MLDIATISESVNNAAHEFPIKGSTFSDRMRKNVRPKKRRRSINRIHLDSRFAPPACTLRDRLEKDLGTSVDIVHAPIPDGSILDVGKR
ncbi:MAG: nucleotidyltransferase domain-containing protein [Eggerthellaceae bacterium]